MPGFNHPIILFLSSWVRLVMPGFNHPIILFLSSWVRLVMPGFNHPIILFLSSWVRLVMPGRSEEHTSELQSQFHLVCRLLLENKTFSSGTFPSPGFPIFSSSVIATFNRLVVFYSTLRIGKTTTQLMIKLNPYRL